MKENKDLLKEVILLMAIFINKKIGVAIFILVLIIGIIAKESSIDYYAILSLYFIFLFIFAMLARKDMIESDLQEYEFYLITGIKNKYIANRLNKFVKFYDIENNKLY